MVLSRFFIPIIHLDVRDGKVWIQHNATEEEADDLMGLGIEGQLGCIVCFCALVRILWGGDRSL
jgi:XisI protein